MNSIKRKAFENEIKQAKINIQLGNIDLAFKHLENAHVIGQNYVIPHVLSHWLMMKLEFKNRKYSWAFGQLIRIVLGAIGSCIGVVPEGNTGGSNVSMWKKMSIKPELQDIVDSKN